MVDTDYIYWNELDKACFQHDIDYSNCNELAKRIESDKDLRDKAFTINRNPRYDGYERDLTYMVSKSFDNKSGGSGQASSLQMNYISQLIENSKASKSILLLKIIFGVLILLICCY